MTSKLTREERVQALYDLKVGQVLSLADIENVKMLSRMALAAMDSEPVAVIDQANLDYLRSGADADVWPPEREEMGDVLLYRHAQPAPEREQLAIENFRSAIEGIGHIRRTLEETFGRLHGTHVEPDVLAECKAICGAIYAAYGHAEQPVVPDDGLIAELLAIAKEAADDADAMAYAEFSDNSKRHTTAIADWERRAAMLQELKKSAGTEAICRSDENVQVLHTKSPAQSDCFPEQNGVAPAQSPIDHGYRPECECSGCKATARICAELSANSPANPDCWCRTCRPVVLNDMRFVVCPDCGNKRCPRANDHRNSCTGSNEPGQEGSAYPDTPQEVNHD
ncbi:hypothetical protein [Klebsiella pneumoniae]|uniref:hypothetical protein n=1 Tax=Klebsiella pneumoniae TaxID=573 RepID=UPI001F5FA412|nr:hypothetical protein [Klebsiella pneumoniae]